MREHLHCSQIAPGRSSSIAIRLQSSFVLHFGMAKLSQIYILKEKEEDGHPKHDMDVATPPLQESTTTQHLSLVQPY